MRADLPDELRQAWARAIFDMPSRDPQAFRVASSNASGVAPARHEDYLDIITITEENLARRRQRS